MSEITESINRFLAGTNLSKGIRTRLIRARDEIVTLRNRLIEAKISYWVSVTESLPKIAAPYIENGEWVLIDDGENPIEIACRVWTQDVDDPNDQEYWKWITTSGEERSPIYWMHLPKPREKS